MNANNEAICHQMKLVEYASYNRNHKLMFMYDPNPESDAENIM